MAKIQTNTEEKVFTIDKFLGLNENPDGDTKLKNGEATICKNWCVTRDRNLRRRKGYAPIHNDDFEPIHIGDGKIAGLWTGIINQKEEMLCACDGHMYKLWDDDNLCFVKEDLGALDTSGRVTFFAFSGIVYILNGYEYYQYDGRRFKTVEGYRPLIAVSRAPDGRQSTLLEEVNKLNGKRRVWVSPDGTATTFVLPEAEIGGGIMSVDYVMDNKTGNLFDNDSYTFDLAECEVIFDTAPEEGQNTIEIGYSVALNYRREVTKMTNFELFSGSQDTRVFLYGDGSNEAFYSSIDYDGKPRADYFPDLNEIAIGESNTPITSLIRHYSSLIAFKTNSAYAISFGLISLADGSEEAGFYSKPINRAVGNVALGQVCLVANNPRTLFGNDLYEWRNASAYTSNLTVDERQARRISDRVYATAGAFDLAQCYCFDDDNNQEWYVCDTANKRALVHNYAADAWYFYDDVDINCAISFHGDMYFGTTDGDVMRFSYDYYSDDGRAFESRWESGSVDFGKPYQNKYSSMLWVGIKPESRGSVNVTVQTDRKADFAEKEVTSFLIDFSDIDFGNFTFDVNRSPQMHRYKLKAKKFVYWKLIFNSNDANTGATVLNASARVRYTGYAK